jgi:hypothetical protein
LALAGDIISIPKNIPHSFYNSGLAEAHYIQEFFPALKIDSLFESFFVLAKKGKLNKSGTPNVFCSFCLVLNLMISKLRMCIVHSTLRDAKTPYTERCT